MEIDPVSFGSPPLPGVVNEAVVRLDVVEPLEKHTATVIFLHGSGDSGDSFIRFAKELSHERPELKHIKWILPSAKSRPCSATASERRPPAIYPLWFDIKQFADLSVGPWDEEGTLESIEAIHGLVRYEISTNGIPPNRIVLAGLSQGSAIAVWSSLTFSDAKIAGVCGLAGRLPARELLQPRVSPLAKDLPYFIAHSDVDPTVPYEIGSKKVIEFLKDVVGVQDVSNEAVAPIGLRFTMYPGRPHFIVLDPVVWGAVGDWLNTVVPK